jgi:hypothetical protein
VPPQKTLKSSLRVRNPALTAPQTLFGNRFAATDLSSRSRHREEILGRPVGVRQYKKNSASGKALSTALQSSQM